MSQAVISAKENTHKEDMVLAKMFEEILREKLDEIFKQNSIITPYPLALKKNTLSCSEPLHGSTVLPGSHG